MKDSLHEALIYAFSHPLALAFAETTRRMGDVVDVPFVGRVVSDPEIAREILLDSKHFNKSGPGSFGAVITQVMGDYALLNMDGEPHLRLRGRLHDLFAPAYLDTVDQEVLSAPIDEFCYRLAAGETLDVVRFAQLLTGRTTWHMLGMTAPESDAEARYLELFELTRRLTASIRLSTRRLSADKAVLKRTTFARLTAPIAEAYTSGKFPDRSVIARLKQLGLTADEARGVVAAILIAGTETLSTAIPRTVALLVDSGQQAVLRAEPGLMQGAIDEALRVVVPTPIMLRSVAADVEIGGFNFRSGQRVMLLTYSLLKNAAAYPRPRRFDIRRAQPAATRNLWFGAGHHFCLGFALAQREMRSVLNAVIALPRELVVRRRTYARGVLIPGYARLEVQMR